MSEQDYRVEQDSMGAVRVPANAKWRAQTQRAVENFPISGRPIERQLIGALASIKGCSAALRGELGMLDPAKANAMHDAAVEVARGDWDEHFPIDVFQTGSGTGTKRNANEVIDTPAGERLGAGPVRHRAPSRRAPPGRRAAAGRYCRRHRHQRSGRPGRQDHRPARRSEEHTSELQSRVDLVCRLLLEKKNNNNHRLSKTLNHDEIFT